MTVFTLLTQLTLLTVVTVVSVETVGGAVRVVIGVTARKVV